MGNLREHDVHSAALIAQLGFIPGEVHYAAKSSGNTYGFLRDNRRITASRLHTNLVDAYGAITSDRNDVVILGPNYDSDMTAALVWANHHSHLLGMSPTPNQPRNDIWQSGTYTPMLTLSGRGNIFKDFTIRHGTAETDLIGMLISGRYNFLKNVYFYSPNVVEQDVAAYIGVSITGHNNYFKGCHFGSEGAVRNAENTNVKIAGSGNIFEDCLFSMAADGTSPVFLHIDTADDRRYTLFKNCTFFCHWVNKGDKITYAMKITGANATTNVIFDSRCQFIGVDYVCDTTDDAHVWMASPGAAAATAYTGISVLGLGT